MASPLGSVLIGKIQVFISASSCKLKYVPRKYKACVMSELLGLHSLKVPLSLVIEGAHGTCLRALSMDCVSDVAIV
jgi:hypothetical protein